MRINALSNSEVKWYVYGVSQCYGSENILRGHRYRLEGIAESKGVVRYRHQGGWQDHANQIIVIYNKI